MKKAFLKHLLPLFLLLLFSADTLEAQRRGRRGKKRRHNGATWQAIKSSCHYFVNDNFLSRATKEQMKADALALARIIEEKTTGQIIEDDYQVDGLAIDVYNMLAYLRLYSKEDLAELNTLAIRKGAVYETYKTNITLEISSLNEEWIVEYTLIFQEGTEWKTKHWKISFTYCEYEYKILSSSTILIPKDIKEVALERALQELRATTK
ncbi:MAG: hypothetical protein ACRBFS_11975 [Aureispira sp.]